MNEEHQQSMAVLNKARNDYNLLQVRLDVSEIINEAKTFLYAEVMDYQYKDGVLKKNSIRIGVPKANDRGIAAILNWMQMIINPQVVQGNFPSDKHGFSEYYDRYIYECQVGLMDLLMVNLYEYDIAETEVQGIISGMMRLIIPFMTRLIDNKERESYGETFKEVTNSNLQDRRKNLPILNQ